MKRFQNNGKEKNIPKGWKSRKYSNKAYKMTIFQKDGGGNIYSKRFQNSKPVEGSSMAGDHNDANNDRTYLRDLPVLPGTPFNW